MTFLELMAGVGRVAEVLITPGIVGILGTLAVNKLNLQGAQKTYADALVRAAGSGMQAAQERGLNPFSPEGRKVAYAYGVNYLKTTVNESAEKLGILGDAQHENRIAAQMATVSAAAVASSQIAAVAVSNAVSGVASVVDATLQARQPEARPAPGL